MYQIQKAQDVLNKNNCLIFYILGSRSFVPASPAVSAGIIVAFCVHPKHFLVPSLCQAISYSNLYKQYFTYPLFFFWEIYFAVLICGCAVNLKKAQFVDIYRITAVWRLRQTIPRIASSQIGGDSILVIMYIKSFKTDKGPGWLNELGY